MTDAEVHALESVACPGAGACGGQFTANTMATALDFLGVSPPGLNEVPATHPGKPQAAVEAGGLAMELVRAGHAAVAGADPRGVRERDHRDRRDRRLDERRPAPARDRRARLGVAARVDDFDTISRAHADRRRHQARSAATSRPTSSRRGRRRARRARARARGRRARGRRSASTAGRSPRSRSPSHERPGQDVVVSWDAPLKPTGGLAILRGTSRRRAASSSSPATSACTTAARRACSTPRRTASPPSRRARSSRATSS